MENRYSTAISLGEVAFHLQEPHDFEWLTNLGHAFRVFDQQDSGNISFGVEIEGKRRFVKYAGAKPLDYRGDPEDAVRRLSQAIPLYAALAHPSLIQLVNHFPVNQGYAAVFEWFDGDCLHSHWSFPPPAKYDHPDSPYYRYKHLPVSRRLESLDAIFSFHAHVESQGYAAVDFYDGSILYDFSNHVTQICDIDFYRKTPSFNDMGEHFWGAARSKSPEEFTLGAPIDARTNVFTMGAIAFGLLGGETDRSCEKWDASLSLYEVALRAVDPERELRYPDVAAFRRAWDAAKLMES
ncbi:serine/threonine protein kinase [Paenibacillus spongiae]|uniref:Serine/threonine protein kinase n=1 Tax=Paenibacillus spongiae TaxID=2909671 RepID=A0ABY5SAE6_9BACL|nr:serine/threonine protein kinase [Paenibacillus spongiae]UVI30500.1 serine/threonine protein kinase [Paenibacillus spongiae]